MKKKISIFALIVLVLPLLALFGCGAKNSFYVDVVSSWTGLPSGTRGGTVSGSGSYEEDKKVTLTATAKPESRFIAWVFEDSVIISQNSTYSISNQKNSSTNKVTKSELSFKASSKTKGKYTAIFDDNKIIYTTLTSWRVTDDMTMDGEDSGTSTTPVTLTANLYISQGSANYDVYSGVNFEVRNNVINNAQINEVFKMNASQPQELSVDFTLTDGMTTFSKAMTAKVPFAESILEFVESDDKTFAYKTNYTQDGRYEIIFKFSFSNEDKFLIVEYTNLNAISNPSNSSGIF